MYNLLGYYGQAR